MYDTYTLVIVDMQNVFTASRSNSVRSACQREILKAKKGKNPIILVEYSTQGKTIPSLSRLVTGYNKTWVAVKSSPDGSKEVTNTILHYKLPRDVRVCGVNTDACVQMTVKGLSNTYCIYSIQVVKDACNSCVFQGNQIGLKNMRGYKRVTIV
jgi:nicotinamidase-related amidase